MERRIKSVGPDYKNKRENKSKTERQVIGKYFKE